MNKYKLKGKAIELRKKGKTYSEIKLILRRKIPKSTLSYWFKNVKLPSSYYQKIKHINYSNITNARKLAVKANKIIRKKFIDSIYYRNEYLDKLISDKDISKIALAMLYLGEGSKWKSHPGLMLGNSDPEIIQIYINLLKGCYNIKPSCLKARISYRADQDINKLIKYWSKITKIPQKSFYKTIPDPRTTGIATKRKDYKGVCVIYCGGTEIQLELDIIAKKFLKFK